MSNTLLQQYGPWALIAGGSEGIGLCFARQLAEAGLNLMLLARRPEPLQAAQEQLCRDFSVEVRTHTMDLTAADLEEQLESVTEGIDIGLLIYNAGAIHGAGLFLDEPLQKTRSLIQLNCLGPAIFSHHLGNRMRQRGRGGILLMSSLSGLTGGAYIAAYAATKAFDIILAESLWAELKPFGVHVLGLVAGATDTPAMAASGIDFEVGHTMDPAVVANEGLTQLPHGPLRIAGAQNRLGAAILRGEDRRQSVALMSAGTAGLYHLPVPDLSTTDMA
ncbi:MAG: SDR family NAD(P)-dependent oxidoreductase [Halioglobus sp.]|nr:SDR family NAD(P)-dependent oxidoreductase [Halioglobus sp.]